jgi:uncharacterized protein (DUF1501 family)
MPLPRLLILVQLKGGNDSLNTTVPFKDPLYRKLRPNIALPTKSVLPLSDRMGLHPAMRELMDVWDDGRLAVMQNIGYPSPNLSHFRSLDIWESGSASHEIQSTGWVAQALASRSMLESTALTLGGGEGVFTGARFAALRIKNMDRFINQATKLKQWRTSDSSNALRRLLAIREAVSARATALDRAMKQLGSLKTAFPSHDFGQQCKLAAEIAASDFPVHCIKLKITGFDTHDDQINRHSILLQELATGLGALRQGLHETTNWDSSLIMTYSEFGRRPKENGNGGTDHGTAATHFLLGGSVQGGTYGPPPDLTNLDERGNMASELDFRGVYSTITKRWWQIENKQLFGGVDPVEIGISPHTQQSMNRR